MGVVIRTGAGQDQLVLSVDDNFLIILTESEKHPQRNENIKVAVLICLPTRLINRSPACILKPIFMARAVGDITLHERSQTDVATSVDFGAWELLASAGFRPEDSRRCVGILE